MKPLLILLAALLTLAAEPVRWKDVQKQPAAWHSGAEAVRIADNLLLYQQSDGGWVKNVEMAAVLTEADRARIRAERDQERSTIDNGATWKQLRFLAEVHSATEETRFKDSFFRGIDFLLASQYENGGWPMIPGREGYYMHITFNDGAMIGVMRLLRDAAQGGHPFKFVDPDRRSRSAKAIEKGLEAILKTQVVVRGKRTVWCAQHDRVDFRPQRARAYELPSLSGGESVGIVDYLMEIEKPNAQTVQAINDAIAWFETSKLTGFKVVDRPDPSLPKGLDRVVVQDESAGPLWARFYDLETNRPMFVGRDGVVKTQLSEIEHERRVGYSWLGNGAEKLLKQRYPAWRAKHLLPQPD